VFVYDIILRRILKESLLKNEVAKEKKEKSNQLKKSKI
jgi:hypothetical protein